MIWLPSLGESGYLVSEMGDIKSPTGKILKQHYYNGQLRVRIRGKKRTVWKLVLEAFAGRPVNGGYRPRHLNGDPFDNRYVNLVYAGAPSRTTSVRVDHCRLGHELVGDNVVVWGRHNRICVKCRDG